MCYVLCVMYYVLCVKLKINLHVYADQARVIILKLDEAFLSKKNTLYR